MTTIRTSCASLAALALLLLAGAPVQAGDLLNLSTRAFVGTGENVLIGGFTITGTEPKPVIIRAIGPSMNGLVLNVLNDPMLDLFKSDKVGDAQRASLQSSDDWRDGQEVEVETTKLAPTDDYEAAMIVKLAPGSYTAVVRGYARSSGMALIDVNEAGTSASRLTTMSSRGQVQPGDAALIGGFTVSGSDTRVLLRAIGPTLNRRHVGNPLSDTTLELRDANGLLLEANDDWRSDNEQAIRATGLAPTDDRESAILRTITPGTYAAIVRGKEDKTGIALVEVYRLPSRSVEPFNSQLTAPPILPLNPQMRENDVTEGFPVTPKN
jgi:hypothetical protein